MLCSVMSLGTQACGEALHPQHVASVSGSRMSTVLQNLIFKCRPSEREHGEKATLFLKMSNQSCLNHFCPVSSPLTQIPSHMATCSIL